MPLSSIDPKEIHDDTPTGLSVRNLPLEKLERRLILSECSSTFPADIAAAVSEWLDAADGGVGLCLVWVNFGEKGRRGWWRFEG